MNLRAQITVVRRDEGARLVAVWEASVRATHDFLTEEDIRFFRPYVEGGLFALDHLIGIRDERGELIAFLGTEGAKLEALFIHPEVRGHGLGRRLTRHAVHEFGVTQVDVNEQNPQAVGFYLHLGFRVERRSPLDGMGKPFPLLHLALVDREALEG